MKPRLLLFLTLLLIFSGCSSWHIEKRRYFNGFYFSRSEQSSHHLSEKYLTEKKNISSLKNIQANEIASDYPEIREHSEYVSFKEDKINSADSGCSNSRPRIIQNTLQKKTKSVKTFPVQNFPAWKTGWVIAFLTLICLIYTPGVFFVSTLLLEGLSKDEAKPNHKWATFCEIMYYPAVAAFLLAIFFLIKANFALVILIDVGIFTFGLATLFVTLLILFAENQKAKKNGS